MKKKIQNSFKFEIKLIISYQSQATMSFLVYKNNF